VSSLIQVMISLRINFLVDFVDAIMATGGYSPSGFIDNNSLGHQDLRKHFYTMRQMPIVNPKRLYILNLRVGKSRTAPTSLSRREMSLRLLRAMKRQHRRPSNEMALYRIYQCVSHYYPSSLSYFGVHM
jgi:hypothetical protein